MSVSDNRILRYAKQTAGIDSTPGTLLFLCTEGLPQRKLVQGKLDRDLRCGDVEKTKRLLGPKDPGITFDTEVYGAYTPGASGVECVSSESLKPLLESFFGAAESAATGDTVSSASGTTLTTSGTNLADNDFVLVTGADSSKNQVRQITSGGGTTSPVINRTLTDDDNTSEVAAAGTVWGGVSYDLTNTQDDRDTLYFDEEGDTTRHEIFGAVPTQLVIEATQGEKARLKWTLDANDWSRNASLANPTYAAEDDGTPAVVVDSPVWFGDTMYMVRDLSITIALKAARRMSQHGVNGYQGIKVTGSDVTISGKLFSGGDNLEAAAAFRDTLNSVTTQDIIVQIGRTAGACLAVRVPAADLTAEEVEIDGLDGLEFTAMATRTSSEGSTCCRLAFF